MTRKTLLTLTLSVMALGLMALGSIYVTNAFAGDSNPCHWYPAGGGIVDVGWYWSVDVNGHGIWPITYSHWNGGHIRFHINHAGGFSNFCFRNAQGTVPNGCNPVYGSLDDYWTPWYDETGAYAVTQIELWGSSIAGLTVDIDKYEYNHPSGNTCDTPNI
jgi:hypothetical protein